MTDRLNKLAERYGIEPGYVSETGDWVETPAQAKANLLAAMGVAAGTLAEIETNFRKAPKPIPTDDAIIPARSAYWPGWLVEHRTWGLSTQIYGLRSQRNWGIGDFEDLANLAETAASFGADFIGVSPLHALFLADPARVSPYSPSSRVFINALLIAPDRVPGFASLPGRDTLTDKLAALRATELVDYLEVRRVKLRALEALFAHFAKAGDAEAQKAFARYCRDEGKQLASHALFEALSEHFVAEGGHASWLTWPSDYQNPKNLAVRDFARGAKKRIEFHTWLQWLADTQLKEAQGRAKAAGMRIGLYLDLAVGISPDGSSSWLGGKALDRRVRIGCPPDAFNAHGQDWGLVPFSPSGLAQERFEPFRALLRAGMRHAGALRLDHAMGLTRLFLIPEGGSAKDGAYLRYPFRQLLETAAEMSWIFRSVLIGEDLGTVPPGFTDTLIRAGLLSYQVLYFTTQDGAFLPPDAYRREALVCAATHDLPTLKGWWTGNDIAWRVKAGQATDAEAETQADERRHDRQLLAESLAAVGLLSGDVAQATQMAEMSDEFLVAVHRFLARTPCRLFCVQIDDALGIHEQANLPGTVNEHPNWRRKMPIPIEELGAHPLFRAVTTAVAAERPRS